MYQKDCAAPLGNIAAFADHRLDALASTTSTIRDPAPSRRLAPPLTSPQPSGYPSSSASLAAGRLAPAFGFPLVWYPVYRPDPETVNAPSLLSGSPSAGTFSFPTNYSPRYHKESPTCFPLQEIRQARTALVLLNTAPSPKRALKPGTRSTPHPIRSDPIPPDPNPIRYDPPAQSKRVSGAPGTRPEASPPDHEALFGHQDSVILHRSGLMNPFWLDQESNSFRIPSPRLLTSDKYFGQQESHHERGFQYPPENPPLSQPGSEYWALIHRQ
ncbi:hypothetical protein BDK51DRAFT_39139 [Blyttiomyces helicus]|uniref:Uncharacterized protein n=1 Tax=Blyttiomyces helicus TaxID=388810 RepID=A0A4P9W956_9FUNG|nr:hypothetical protein BDK51DRAFT_39139 [Blyttiomyces helicus]|eukprot:RKO88025.1 hypothetical protein BDK51DRAFT_39139 [Blyttiomyces helicus]